MMRTNPFLFFLLGMTFLVFGVASSAVHDPEEARAHLDRARQSQYPVEREDHYKAAIRYDSTLADAYAELGGLYTLEKRYDEASALYKKALRRFPDAPVIHRGLGDLYYATGEYPKVVDRYKRVAQLMPDDATAHNNLGYAYQQVGQLDKAVEEYHTAIRLDSTYVMPLNNLGILYESTLVSHPPHSFY